MTTLYTLHWTDNSAARQLAATDSDRLQPVVYHGLQSGAPFEVRLNGKTVAIWRGAGGS